MIMEIKGLFEWIPLTIFAIFRNKRRSFAMISGIILGVTILSGIFIYTAVLNQQNFDTVVENASYEIRFDIVDNETISNMNKLVDMIHDDPRVEDTAIFASAPDNFGTSITNSKKTVAAEQAFSRGRTTVVPMFVQDTFKDTKIGQKISKGMDGSFEFSGNSTVVPRSYATIYQLKVGDVIDEMNITFTDFNNDNGVLFPSTTSTLKNVKIVGIYEEPTGDSGLFGSLFATYDLYFSFDTLDKYMKDIDSLIKSDNGYFLGVKIKESEFSVSDPETMVDEISKFISQVSKKGEEQGLEVTGYNMIAALLLPFQITSIFLTIFDVLLAAPVVILSLYLLFFGLEMSLEERRREIAIKKVQGADSRQIFAELRNEAIVLFIIGYIIGYIGGIIGAWLISSAIGFMRLQPGGYEEFQAFFRYDKTAIIWSVVIVGGIMIWQTTKQGKSFIEQEVSEAVQKFKESKDSFIKRNKIDAILLFIGIVNLSLSVLSNEFNYDLKLNLFLKILINGLGPFFLWIGGALFGARVSKYVPQKLQRFFLALPQMSDVARVIRSGLKRRGDTNKLAIIIVLTLSIATLAAAQGNTQQIHSIRNLEWEIGSDFQVNFAVDSNYTSTLMNVSGVSDVLPIGFTPDFRILSSTFKLAGINITKEYLNYKNNKNIGIWHVDTFTDMDTATGLEKLYNNPNGIFISEGTGYRLDIDVGDKINLKITVGDQSSGNTSLYTISNVEVLGIYDHIPGNIQGGTIFSSSNMVQKIRAISDNRTIDAYKSLEMNASRYLVKTNKGMDMSVDEANDMIAKFAQLNNIAGIRSLKTEINNLLNTQGSYGISGLLSLDFLVAVIAALISTFAFSAIIMERRKREFAVLRAIGARKSQIYKLALGENFLLVLAAVIWGTFIGIGITYQFNGVFEVFGVFLGSGPLNRIVFFPWVEIILIGLFTMIGMLLATMLSVRSAANQDLSIATRVI